MTNQKKKKVPQVPVKKEVSDVSKTATEVAKESLKQALPASYSKLIPFTEAVIAQRNIYQAQLVDRFVNVIYFKKQMMLTNQTFPENSQERTDATTNYNNAHKALENDQIVMESFDELLETLARTPVETKKEE